MRRSAGSDSRADADPLISETHTRLPSPRPNAGAGPIISASSSTGTQITLVASAPVDRVVIRVNTAAQAQSERLSPMVVLGSYYELRLSSPRQRHRGEHRGWSGNGVELFPGDQWSRASVVRGLEGSIRSIDSLEAAAILFTNSSGQPRRVIWLDFNGRRVFYRALQAGESYLQPTFGTHPWISATSNDVCQAIYSTPRGQSQVALR